MKPHIYRFGGIWICRTIEAARFRLGYGYTPSQAYGEWKEQE